jgi:hypothetical protein
LSSENDNLQARFARLLSWERRKRREANLVTALFYALVGALCALPLFFLARHWIWAVPLALFAALAPYFLFTRRWRERDTARAMATLDKRLELDERATTAWEFLRRGQTGGVALLVLRQAEAGLKGLEPRALFPRAWHWQWYWIAPLFALWLGLLWLGAAPRADSVRSSAPAPLSQKLREFARRLQEKAHSEGLPQTLQAGRELEKIAQRGIDSKTADEQFKTELAGMAKKLAAERHASAQPPQPGSASRQELEDLRAELEGARDFFNSAEGATHSWEERLTGFTQLRKQLQKQEGGALAQNPEQLKTFLEKLEKQVTGELDRRALLEAEQYLKQLAQHGQNPAGEAQARAGGTDEQPATAPGEGEKTAGSAPGEEPGKDTEKQPSLPEFRGGARAQVKGTIGEGERSGILFKAKPAPGKSRLSQDEVIASYRRQAESELNTEKIPGDLKDTIRNYFLSLEKGKERME